MRLLKPLLLLLFSISNAAIAADFDSRFQDWSVFKSNRGDKIICYVISTPIKYNDKFNNAKSRGESFLMVTNVENDADEVSLSSGIDFDDASSVEMSFGSKKYNLFPYLARAWANNKNDDIDIIKKMQKSSDVIVTASASDGRIFHDEYSLIGFSSAYLKMKKICKD